MSVVYSNGFFVEDTVALREDWSILAVVDSTWRDIRSGGPSSESDWVSHSGVPLHVRLEYNREGRCPRGYVIIGFLQPYSGFSLIAERSLILVDRCLMLGDVVKKQPSNAESGTVIRSNVTCMLQPIYNGLSLSPFNVWPHKEEDNILRRIPREELRYLEDYQRGDKVVHQDWVGTIADIFKEITIRMNNGSVVAFNSLEHVEVPGPAQQEDFSQNHLLHLLAYQRKRTLETSVSSNSVFAEEFHPGQFIRTTKASLRLGKWIHGRYDASIPPCGLILNIQITELSIRWLFCNPSVSRQGQATTPPTTLNRGEFGELRRYDKGRVPRSSTAGPCVSVVGGLIIAAGDYVRFRDATGAAVKYGLENDTHGRFRRIPKSETLGFDMNVFLVIRTETKVEVQWQDMTTSEHNTNALVPYLNVDDHDLWPGEIVSAEEDGRQSSYRGAIQPKNIGVVQWADARERLARVRWFANPEIEALIDPEPILLPGSTFGELSTRETTVSLYEVVAHQALNQRRGDLVVIRPGSYSKAPESLFTSFLPSFLRGSNVKHNWLGEIVDLGLDGLLTIRLGLLDEIFDVQLPIETVIAIVGTNDESSDSGGLTDVDDAAIMDDLSNGRSDSDEILEETVEYEGGSRLDADSDESIWTTDDENNGLPDETAEIPLEENLPSVEATVPTEPSPNSSREYDYRLTEYASMPTQFDVLDEPVPRNHHFFTESVTLTAALMRRIRREHTILESSLPEGIWVRGWADNLSILRALIVGPQGTPYSLAPFVIDFRFKADFPKSPPEAFFHSWTNYNGRINPNLYEDGTVCLSLLGTWPGVSKNERWSEESSMLQVIVSLMGLVLVAEPFYNEAGFEAFIGASDTRINSALYTEKALVMAKGFVVHALSHKVVGMEPIINWLYKDKVDGPQLLRRVLSECDALLANGIAPSLDKPVTAEKDGNVSIVPHRSNFGIRISAGAKVPLRRHADFVRGYLAGMDRL